jgi:phosphate starvation-inducible PhoH-like protein
MSKRFKSKKRSQIHSQTPNLTNEFKPCTRNQAEYVRSIIESDVTICYGVAGTGKSMCAIGVMCQGLIDNKIDNVLISRSIVGCDGGVGFLPGGIGEKIEPYMLPYIEYFEYFLGHDRFYKYLNYGNIKFCPVELLRGRTYNNCIMLLEETQNCTPKQIKLFLSRLGHNSRAVVLGDNRQSDIHSNGLKFCIEKLGGVKGLNMVEMDYSDVMRHKIIPEIMSIFDDNSV